MEIGRYTISVSKESFLPVTKESIINTNETTTLNFTLASGEPFIQISDSTKNLASYQGNFSINLYSNAGWTVHHNSAWLQSETDYGEGDKILHINYSKNESVDGRTDTIYFKCGSIERSLLVYQSSPIILLEKEAILGDLMKDVEDSVHLRFNKRVIVEEIKVLTDHCVAWIQHESIYNGYGVSFNYGCAEMGDSYPFLVELSDYEGNYYTDTLQIPFYKSGLTIEGDITDYILLENQDEVLISSRFPDRILKYSISQDSVLRSYDLSQYLSPTNITFNPWDGKIYMVGVVNEQSITGLSEEKGYVFSLDLSTHEIIKAITIERDSSNVPPFDPPVYPFDIGFTITGHGVVCLRNSQGGGEDWKLVDCEDNFRVYEYPYYNDTITKHYKFQFPELNHDNTKLYVWKSPGSHEIAIFNGYSRKFSLVGLDDPWPGSCLYFSAHRYSDKLYTACYNHEYIIDLEGNHSTITNFYIDRKIDADFSYRPDEENMIYYFRKDLFRLVDYNTGTVLSVCNVAEYYEHFTSTTDGDHVLCYRNNLDPTSTFCVVDTKYFYTYID